MPVAHTHETATVVAVISAYHPPAELAGRATALLDQVDRVVVVDDGTASARALGFADERILVEELARNVGIAGALNRGIRLARSLGATHVLTLDQDSDVHEGYVAAALASMAEYRARGLRPGAVVPASVAGDPVTTIGRSNRALDPIQSGQVITMEAFDRLGGFDERFVIDAVDSEFTLRLRHFGWELLVVPGTDLGHSLGELTPLTIGGRHVRVLGRPRHIRYHAPFRTYYMLRNGLALWRFHRRGNVAWLFQRTAYHLVVDIACSALAAPDRARQLHAVRFALRDALRRRLGPLPSEVRRVLSR